MAKITRGEEAAIYLRQSFGVKSFSFEEAQKHLALTNFANGGKFVKNSCLCDGEQELFKQWLYDLSCNKSEQTLEEIVNCFLDPGVVIDIFNLEK